MALTTIPSELSSVSGIADSSDATAITIDSSENATFAGDVLVNKYLRLRTTDDQTNQWYLYTHTDDTFRINYNGAGNDEIVIDTSGRVGIGETSPTRFFVVKRSDSAGTVAEFENTGTSSYIQFTCNSQADNAAGYVGYNSDKDLTLWTNDVQRVTIDVNGYMGIGEQSPDNKLHVTGGDWNNAHIRIERTDNGSANDPGVVFKSAAGANNAYGLGSIWFQNALDGNAYAMIRARTDDASGTSGKIEFVTSTSAVGNATTPALTIDSNQIPVFRQGSYEAEIHHHSWASTLETRTSDGADNYAVGLDAGSGAGSNARGAGIWCYGNENGSHPGAIVAQMGAAGVFKVFAGASAAEALRIDASGHLLPGSDSAKNLGSTSKRWDNLYVNDMHFSNEGSDGNDVDGTTGDWTLQEGEEHLYIINNKSGKKFKFSLEEVE